MRKLLIPVLLAGSLTVGGCTTAGLAQQVLGSVLSGAAGGGQRGYDNRGYSNQNFQQAAVNACGQQAQQYGQVRIDNVQQRSSSTLSVFGTIQSNNYQQRRFVCSFSSNGRIVDFQVER